MIGLKSRYEFEDFSAGCPGTLTTSSLCGIYVVPFACQLKGVLARLGTAGGTQATIVDIQKNGSSIFSGATKVNFAASSQTPTYGALSVNPTTFVKGDILKIAVTQVGSTPGPADLALGINLQRLRGSFVSAMVIDGVGPEAE
jgi:hypothetical protein